MLLCQTVCHCLYSHVSQFIVQSTSLTAICNTMLGRFVNVSRRFERSQSHRLLGQLVKEGCTLQRLKSVGPPLSEPQTSLSLSLSPTHGLQHPHSYSAPRHIGCSARSYTARSDNSLFPAQKPPFYVKLINYHSDHTHQVRVEKCVTKCGNSSHIRHFL